MTNKCGSCSACCRVYAIPQLQKSAHDWCKHCVIGESCKIYEARPQVCVEFECMWLQSQSLEPRERWDVSLRPDKSKVVFGPSSHEKVIAVTTMPNAKDAWKRPAIKALIDRLIASGLFVVVGAPASTERTLFGPRGSKTVQMTEPDENGMQWSTDKELRM